MAVYALWGVAGSMRPMLRPSGTALAFITPVVAFKVDVGSLNEAARMIAKT
jgi:hypothetical protein